MKTISIITLFAAALLAGCAKAPPPPPGPAGSLTLREGACVGECPIYIMTLHSDDSYLLESKKFTRYEGISRGALHTGAWRAAVEAMATAGFTDIAGDWIEGDLERCPTSPPDMPDVELLAFIDGENSAMRYYYGCNGLPEHVRIRELVDRLRIILRHEDLIAPA